MRRWMLAVIMASGLMIENQCRAQDEPIVSAAVAPIKPAVKSAAVPPVALQWQTQVREVLQIVGDDKLPGPKRTAAYEALMKVKPSPQEDTRLQLAYVLLALNQKKNADALKLTEQITSVAPNDAPALAMQARLLLLVNFKTTQATVALESLIEALRNPAPTASPPVGTRGSLSRFGGRLF